MCHGTRLCLLQDPCFRDQYRPTCLGETPPRTDCSEDLRLQGDMTLDGREGTFDAISMGSRRLED